MIQLIQGFKLSTRDAVDNRLVLTKAEMASIDDRQMPEKYFAVCKDNGLLYTYDKSAVLDSASETGKFTVYGAGSTIESITINGEIIPISEFGNVDIPVATIDRLGVSKAGKGITVSSDGIYSIDFNAVDDASIPIEKINWEGVILVGDNISVM